MREALFIKKNRDKWIRYQHEPDSEPDEQADRFITLLDDLAYSKTFYPQSKVTRWINSIAVSIYQNIYQSHREKSKRLITFWTTELPLLFYKHRKILLFAFLFFGVCVAIGAISSANDDLFIKAILGEGYVLQTEENIQKGDPFGIYRDSDKFSMFVMIAVNNIRVALQTFVAGIFFGIGTLYLLLYNGIMVGAFEQMFFARGLGLQSLMVIWIHGTLEIASIIIAGAAGLIMGNSILFPGTFSRFTSFKKGAKDALKIAICLVPFFVSAALLESYVTYLMSNTYSNLGDFGLPVWAGVLILIVSASLIIWYFVIYPVQVHRSQSKKRTQKSKADYKAVVWQD